MAEGGHSGSTARLAARKRSSEVEEAKDPHLLEAGARKDPVEDSILDVTARVTASAAVAVDTGGVAGARMSAAAADVGAVAGADADTDAEAAEAGHNAVIAAEGHIAGVAEARIVVAGVEGNTSRSRGSRLGWG